MVGAGVGGQSGHHGLGLAFVVHVAVLASHLLLRVVCAVRCVDVGRRRALCSRHFCFRVYGWGTAAAAVVDDCGGYDAGVDLFIRRAGRAGGRAALSDAELEPRSAAAAGVDVCVTGLHLGVARRGRHDVTRGTVLDGVCYVRVVLVEPWPWGYLHHAGGPPVHTLPQQTVALAGRGHRVHVLDQSRTSTPARQQSKTTNQNAFSCSGTVESLYY